MTSESSLFLITGVVAMVYGLLLLWNAKQGDQEQEQRKWMQAEEVVNSRFNKLENMRYLMRPERQNISFSKSKGRAYAMLAIGLALIVMAFT